MQPDIIGDDADIPYPYAVHIDGDLEAVVKALYAAVRELSTTNLPGANGVKTDGTITYGPLRLATGIDPRWVEERFDRFFELPQTITRRTADGREESTTSVSTYLGVRELKDQCVTVSVIGLNEDQQSVMAQLLARLKEDYPEIGDRNRISRKSRDRPMPLTPATTDPATRDDAELSPARGGATPERRRDNGLITFASLDALKASISQTLAENQGYTLTEDNTAKRIGIARSTLYERLKVFEYSWPELKEWLQDKYPHLRRRR